MHLFKGPLLLLTLSALLACSSVQVSQDYDPQIKSPRAESFGWRDAAQPAIGDVRIDNPLLDRRIRQAVEKHLIGRGMTPVRENADVSIAYHLIITPRIEADVDYPYMGIGRYPHPWYGGLGMEQRVRQFDECHLTIDILAAGSGDLIWRGTGIFRYRSYDTPHAAGAAMQKTVDRILQQFPPRNQH